MSFYGFIIGLSVSLGIYLLKKATLLSPKNWLTFLFLAF